VTKTLTKYSKNNNLHNSVVHLFSHKKGIKIKISPLSEGRAIEGPRKGPRCSGGHHCRQGGQDGRRCGEGRLPAADDGNDLTK
jgi:hypothetical protein